MRTTQAARAGDFRVLASGKHGLSDRRDGSKTPYVTHTLSAKVEGVTVLAQGGDSPVLKKNITEVIEALFDIEPHKIKVAKMADTR